VAVDDHIITNVLSGNIVVPQALLLANDTDADKDPLTASPTSFNTGWIAKGADFTGTNQNFSFTGGNEQAVTLARSAFVANTAAMTAVLVVSGAWERSTTLTIRTTSASTSNRVKPST